MVYSGARGTLIYEKNLKSKISCQTPFNIWLKWIQIWQNDTWYRSDPIWIQNTGFNGKILNDVRTFDDCSIVL